MKKNIVKSTIIVMALTLFSKALGFVKSLIQASYFGVSATTDSLNVAEGFVSNIIFLFATAISVAFVPIYIKKKESRCNEEKQLVTSTLLFFYIFSILVSIVLFVCAKPIMKVAAPSYEGNQLEQTICFFRVLLVGFVFAIGTNIIRQLLNAERVYGFVAASSLINSVVVICSIILLQPSIGIWSLLVAWILSYLVQNLIFLIRGRKFIFNSGKISIWNDSIKQLLVQSTPILISQGSIEINQIVDKALLSRAEIGSITVVTYAMTLYELVAQIFKTSFSTILFTEFAEMSAKGEKERIGKMLNSNVLIVSLVCLPIMIVVYFGAGTITDLVYGHGNFDSNAVERTALALTIYIWILMADVIKSIVNRAYYCLSDTRTPMVMGIIEVIINIIVSIILSCIWGMVGVLIGTLIAENVMLFILVARFNRRKIGFINSRFVRNVIKILLAGVIAAAIGIVFPSVIVDNEIIDCIFKMVIVGAVYFIILFLEKEDEIETVICRLKKGISKKRGENS